MNNTVITATLVLSAFITSTILGIVIARIFERNRVYCAMYPEDKK